MNNRDTRRDNGPRMNNRIFAKSVQVITSDGQNLGVMPTSNALEMAENAGMPLPGQRGRKAPKLPAGDEITLKDTGLAPKSVKKKITPRNMRKAR